MVPHIRIAIWLSRAKFDPAPILRRLLAMEKVVGSSPIIRFTASPAKSVCRACTSARRRGTPHSARIDANSSRSPGVAQAERDAGRGATFSLEPPLGIQNASQALSEAGDGGQVAAGDLVELGGAGRGRTQADAAVVVRGRGLAG